MNWTDKDSFIKIYPPKEFNFKECLVFLDRDSQEILHEVKEDCLYKLISVNGKLILFKMMDENNFLKVEFLNTSPSTEAKKEVALFIWEWFDLDTKLDEFYTQVK